MAKVELLKRIQKLASLVHGSDLQGYQLTEECVDELRRALDALTEEYMERYCETSY
ncbi:MAG TPA: hypothetical protein PKA10_19955 [Selenomonadales bacterium]|nr:hypothetical protein [Selenomonadales bacterium]